MMRLLFTFTVLILLTTGCGVLTGDVPCCGPATATPVLTSTTAFPIRMVPRSSLDRQIVGWADLADRQPHHH